MLEGREDVIYYSAGKSIEGRGGEERDISYLIEKSILRLFPSL